MIDYNAMISFKRQPPVGFFDTSKDVKEDDRHNFNRLRREDVDGVKRDVKEAVSELCTLQLCITTLGTLYETHVCSTLHTCS